MKSISLAASAILVFFLSACNQASAKGGDPGLEARVDSLATMVSTMHEEFEVLKYGLEKRGLSIEQLKSEMEMDNKVWDIPEDGSPVFGNSTNPKLTIVEFSDFQCPYCSRIAPAIHELMQKHSNEIRFIYKHFPLSFHTNSPSAAAASMAAQKQGKFWEFRYALAPHYKELSPEMYEKVAKEVGLDMVQFKKDMVLDSAKQARLNEDFQLGAKIGVQGTPNFFVNGKRQDRFSPQMIENMLQGKK